MSHRRRRTIRLSRLTQPASGGSRAQRHRYRNPVRHDDTQPESSTSQSLTRGAGDIECAYLSGEIALLGQLHGIPTPANRALQMAAERAASSGAAAGSFISSADLMALAKL